MQPITTIGFDIAKSVFQVHGVDAVGEVVRRHRTPGLGARQFQINPGPFLRDRVRSRFLRRRRCLGDASSVMVAATMLSSGLPPSTRAARTAIPRTAHVMVRSQPS